MAYIKESFKELLFITLFFLSIQSSGQDQFFKQLADSALALTKQHVIYDPSYFNIDYPGGDVPADKGVCTDVIIRAYRKMGIDLQKELHEDIKANFDVYPKKWGLDKPDKNIDHRRVPNLIVFFSRFGTEKPLSKKSGDYLPGDIVTWDLGGGITHIGIVVNKRSPGGEHHMVVHNIGNGQVIEDCLFSYRITGHFTYKK